MGTPIFGNTHIEGIYEWVISQWQFGTHTHGTLEHLFIWLEEWVQSPKGGGFSTSYDCWKEYTHHLLSNKKTQRRKTHSCQSRCSEPTFDTNQCSVYQRLTDCRTGWMTSLRSTKTEKLWPRGPVVSLDEKVKGWRARRWKTHFLPNYAGTFPFYIGITSSKCVFFGALYRGNQETCLSKTWRESGRSLEKIRQRLINSWFSVTGLMRKVIKLREEMIAICFILQWRIAKDCIYAFVCPVGDFLRILLW